MDGYKPVIGLKPHSSPVNVLLIAFASALCCQGQRYQRGTSLIACGFQAPWLAQAKPAELQTAAGFNSSMPAVAARGPDVGGHLCLVCEAEMEISGSPGMGMCTRRITDENLWY